MRANRTLLQLLFCLLLLAAKADAAPVDVYLSPFFHWDLAYGQRKRPIP